MLALPLVLAAVLFAQAAPPAPKAPDPAKLEKVRRMPPEQRKRLKEQLDQWKKLPPQDQERMKENLKKLKSMRPEEARELREKLKKINPEERMEFSEMASRWNRHHRENAQGFPRGLFFLWLKSKKPEVFKELRKAEPGARQESFQKISAEFREFTAAKIQEHAAKHGCASAEKLKSLRETAPREFWAKYQELMKACRNTPKK